MIERQTAVCIDGQTYNEADIQKRHGEIVEERKRERVCEREIERERGREKESLSRTQLLMFMLRIVVMEDEFSSLGFYRCSIDVSKPVNSDR